MKKILKNLLIFEGTDGSGTTTQVNMLKKALKEQNSKAFYDTYEPTESLIGRLLRSALKKEIAIEKETMAYLFAADRHEHLYEKNGLVERCERGELVICDRYILSSLVYQGLSCGNELPALLNKDFPLPEMLLFFDIDPEFTQKRMEKRQNKDIFETLDFQIQVRRRYLELLPEFRSEGVIVELIDASLTIDEVAAKVWEFTQKMPIFVV